MKNLYKMTANEAIQNMVDEVAEAKGITKTLAKQLVINALIYNCVQDEILGQVDFLLDEYNGIYD